MTNAGRPVNLTMPPSPMPSFTSIRLKQEDLDDIINNDNIMNSSYDRSDDDDDQPAVEGRIEQINCSRSMDDTLTGNDDKDGATTAELERENERLRTELLLMRSKMNRLKSRLNNEQNIQHQYYNNRTATGPSTPLSSLHEDVTSGGGGVLLELPLTMRNTLQKNGGSKSSLDIPNGNGGKDHQSVSTTDERSTIEPNVDLEAHQSGAGLHRRGDVTNCKNHPTANNSNETLKTNPTADDSLSSNNSYDDEELERLIEERGAITSNNHAAKVDGIIRDPGRTAGTSAPAEMPFFKKLADRAGWLVGLLVFQSLSSFILARNEELLRHHAVIVQFLTMLVGAGGNAGNQASVGVVRGLAVGTIDRSNMKRFLRREFALGFALSIILGVAGFARAAVFAIPWLETMAITSSLFMIVIISVVAGALLPLGMSMVGIDPAHSSTTIQVIMDITGVVITVHMSSLILDTDFRFWLENLFSLKGVTR